MGDMGSGDLSQVKSHPLCGLDWIAPEVITALTSRWITTVEDTLGMTATDEGRRGLQELLKLEDAAFGDFLAKLAAKVGQEKARLLQQAPAKLPPAGVVLTDEEKKRMRLG